MNYTLTTTLSSSLFAFLNKEASVCKTTKKAIIEAALKEYKKKKLQEEIAKGFLERQEEYQKNASDFMGVQISSLQD